MQRFLTTLLVAILAICIVSGQSTIDSAPPTCGCCPSVECRAKSVPCSTNGDCDCLFMTMTGGGMCADTVVSCRDLVPCESDNKTCSVPNTICVNNTRCKVPVCYPMEYASSQRCPPLSQTVSNTTTNAVTPTRNASSSTMASASPNTTTNVPTAITPFRNSRCNQPGPFVAAPIVGGAGCRNLTNYYPNQLTFCGSR
ncbi:unnamed protein product [Rotaria sordida]|uniref:Uncharacterized protein n=3 Tax=Rotaria sordida TaxID=392033 RepID=A0A819V7N5_9BILA|nr:unnamed protein product [Rotaria sordida]